MTTNSELLTTERVRARAILSHPSAGCYADLAEALVASEYSAELCLEFLDAATRDRDALIAAHNGDLAAARRTLAQARGEYSGVGLPETRGTGDTKASWERAFANLNRDQVH